MIQINSFFTIDYKNDKSIDIYTIEGSPVLYTAKYSTGVQLAPTMNLKLFPNGSITVNEEKPSAEIQELAALSMAAENNINPTNVKKSSSALSDLIYGIIGGAFIGGVILIIVKLIKNFRKKLLTPKGNMSTIRTMSSNVPSSKVSPAEKSQGTATNPKFCSECGAAVQSLNAKFCTECGNKLM